MKRALILAAGAAIAMAPLVFPVALQAQTKAKTTAAYRAPRIFGTLPDLQGNWTNATVTPEVRPTAAGTRLIATKEEVDRLEGNAAALAVADNNKIDPNAPPPSVGGDLDPGQTQFSAAGGNVGGYNRGWLDPGSQVMRVNGEPRTSFLTTPDGKVPPRKGAAAGAAGGRGGLAALAGRGGGAPGAGRGAGAPPAAGGRGGAPGAARGAAPARVGFGPQFDNPENRGGAERCLSSFGRNAPPPMMPNGFYNNNYHLVQGRDSVVIIVEMVHDARTVRLNGTHRTDGVRPYFGDSIGHYEGDTLVVSTTNLPRGQAYNGSWENLEVIEKFTRVAPDRLKYQYVIHDPTMWDADWGGEYEFGALNGEVYEYACHEGNYALEGILAGARAAEQDAARDAPVPLGRALNAPVSTVGRGGRGPAQ